MNIQSVYVVFASDEEARRVGRQVVEEKLAACVNLIGPVTSFYRWEGKVAETQEVAAIIKTSSKVIERLKVRLAALHSYVVPSITVWPVESAGQDFTDWVEESTE